MIDMRNTNPFVISIVFNNALFRSLIPSTTISQMTFKMIMVCEKKKTNTPSGFQISVKSGVKMAWDAPAIPQK